MLAYLVLAISRMRYLVGIALLTLAMIFVRQHAHRQSAAQTELSMPASPPLTSVSPSPINGSHWPKSAIDRAKAVKRQANEAPAWNDPPSN